MGTNSIRVGPGVTYGAAEFSPVVPQEGFGLWLSVVPALSDSGELTAALFASCRTPGRYADVYGGRQVGAMRIVAIDVDRGSVFENTAESGSPVPLYYAMDPDPKPSPPGIATVESTVLRFSADLREHLNLPSFAATYSVFLWLDEMTSVVMPVDMPGPTGPPVASKVPDTRLKRVPSAPEDLGRRFPVLRRDDGHARGVVHAGSGPFTLLGLDYRSRQIRIFADQAEDPDSSSLDVFEFDPIAAFAGPGWLDAQDPPRKGFELLYSQGAISEVLIVEPV